MKRSILLVLLFPGMLLGATNVSAQTSDWALKALEVEVERLAETTLPDFAPQSFRSVRTKIRELRAIYEKEGRVPPELLAEARQALEQFQIAANGTRKTVKQSYDWRNAAMKYNFARSSDPAALYRAEQSYREALKLAGEGKFEEARRSASQAKRQYKTLIREAHSRTKKTQRAVLKAYKKGVKSDISALNASPGSLNGAKKIDAATHRIRPLDRPRFGLEIDGNVEPPYIPPTPPPDGPIPPVNVWVTDRTANSLKIWWTDVSSDEDGNRLMRSTNLVNWPIILAHGPIPRITNFSFVDTNLSPDTRHCYAIETFNPFGTRRSKSFCGYTRDGNNIRVWRLQLRVKVADFQGAGLLDDPLRVFDDEPLHVYVGGVKTILDYGRDDFARNDEFTYDLNIEHLNQLSDITNLLISTRSTDPLYLEEFTFLINQQEVFSRHFGSTPDSALLIGDSYMVEFEELRNHQSWRQFVNHSVNFLGLILAPLIVDLPDGRRQLVIPAKDLVSRTESLVGHLLNADEETRKWFRWGYITDGAVEVSKANDQTLHFDLDLEGKLNNWPNPSVDLDFDIELATKCDNATRILTVDLTSKNFTSNTDFTWWKDLLSVGLLPLSNKVIQWFANECLTPPKINESFDVQLPAEFNCSDISIKINDEAGVDICCF